MFAHAYRRLHSRAASMPTGALSSGAPKQMGSELQRSDRQRHLGAGELQIETSENIPSQRGGAAWKNMRLSSPFLSRPGPVLDGSDNPYISDSADNRMRRVPLSPTREPRSPGDDLAHLRAFPMAMICKESAPHGTSMAFRQSITI